MREIKSVEIGNNIQDNVQELVTKISQMLDVVRSEDKTLQRREWALLNALSYLPGYLQSIAKEQGPNTSRMRSFADLVGDTHRVITQLLEAIPLFFEAVLRDVHGGSFYALKPASVIKDTHNSAIIQEALPKIYYYQSGEKMSEGGISVNKENGAWVFYDPSGQLQASGNYKDGVEDGGWKWYNEEGKILKKGAYQYGLAEGPWIFYHGNGLVSDSGNFSQGRESGEWIKRTEAGIITSRIQYERSQPNGEALSFYDDGKPFSKGSFEKGIRKGIWQFWHQNEKLYQEIDYISETKMKVINAWDKSGKQMVTNGNGILNEFYASGNRKEVIKIVDGKNTGVWKTLYENGNRKEDGEFKNDFATSCSPGHQKEMKS